ncbi:hypothetical protein JCM8208_004134 [Rhodotorula glutinis]
MGAQGSKPDHEATPDNADQSFFAARSQPVNFSESLINHLQSQSTPTSAVPASRQQALDSHIQQRLAHELDRLRQDEQHVRSEIERALEKENLDRERGATQGEGEGEGKALPHSASLLHDLGELEKRAQAVRRERAQTDEWRRVDLDKDELAKCFRDNKETPLECRDKVEAFKRAVAGVESSFFQTMKSS